LGSLSLSIVPFLEIDRTMSPVYAVLVIESDPLLREMISDVLALHRNGLAVVAAATMDDAREIVQSNPIDLVIADADDPESAKKFFNELHSGWPEMPLLILTGAMFSEFYEIAPAAKILRRPPEMDEMLGAVDELLLQRKDSILHGISLPSFLQMLHHDRTSCTLAVSSGNRTGHIFFDKGKLIHATMANIEGKQAFIDILTWPEYTVRVIPRCSVRVSITDSLTGLLLDWSLLVDNRNTEKSWTPTS
jgi:CheY-like chemotaxis protein